MKELAEFKKYQIITVPDLNGVNCLYLNNALIHCSYDELPNSAKTFGLKVDYARIEMKNKEFLKVNRFLTDRCLLFTKKKIYLILYGSFYLSSQQAIKEGEESEERRGVEPPNPVSQETAPSNIPNQTSNNSPNQQISKTIVRI